MTILYLDASAWVKRYYDERGSERVLRLLSDERPKACSVLGVVEVIAALARKCKALEIGREDFEAKVAEVERDWRTFVQIALTHDMVEGAKLAAARLARRGADAVHFAALHSLERRLADSGHQVILVASDRELVEAAEASDITVIDPESEPAV